MSTPLRDRLATLVDRLAARADRLDAAADEAARTSGIRPGQLEPAPILAQRRDATTYRAVALEIRTLLETDEIVAAPVEYATTET